MQANGTLISWRNLARRQDGMHPPHFYSNDCKPGHHIFVIIHVEYEPNNIELQGKKWRLFHFAIVWPMCSATGEKLTAM